LRSLLLKKRDEGDAHDGDDGAGFGCGGGDDDLVFPFYRSSLQLAVLNENDS